MKARRLKMVGLVLLISTLQLGLASRTLRDSGDDIDADGDGSDADARQTPGRNLWTLNQAEFEAGSALSDFSVKDANNDYPFNDLPAAGLSPQCYNTGVAQQTPETCSLLCMMTSGCKTFVMGKNGQAGCCWLKARQLGSRVATADRDTYFGFSKQVNIDFWWNDITTGVSTDAQCYNTGAITPDDVACATKCLGTQGCMAFVWQPASTATDYKCCWIKTALDENNIHTSTTKSTYRLVNPYDGA